MQDKRDVRCLACKRTFRNVYPDKPSGKCQCNGYTADVPWEWCNADEEARRGRQEGVVDVEEEGELREVECPVCKAVNALDAFRVVESKGCTFVCNSCQSTLTIDAHRQSRTARHQKIWNRHPASCYQPAPPPSTTDTFNAHLKAHDAALYHTAEHQRLSHAYEAFGV